MRQPSAATSGARLVVLTGLSGSGKGTILKVLEDLGFYCVDNLPIDLIAKFAELTTQAGEEIHRAALLVDIREGEALERFPHIYRPLRKQVRPMLVFVEASDESLLRRFSETRRPHPLGRGRTVLEGIRRERQLLKPIRALADLVIDTSRFNVHELRRFVLDRFRRTSEERAILISMVSFGYRFGLPADSDLVFDVRFLPNPNFVPQYKPLTGRNRRVARYIQSFPQTREFIDRISDLLAYLIPHFIREGKSYLTIGFGCTGGRHRSVALAEAVRERLARQGFRARVVHRDLAKS